MHVFSELNGSMVLMKQCVGHLRTNLSAWSSMQLDNEGLQGRSLIMHFDQKLTRVAKQQGRPFPSIVEKPCRSTTKPCETMTKHGEP